MKQKAGRSTTHESRYAVDADSLITLSGTRGTRAESPLGPGVRSVCRGRQDALRGGAGSGSADCVGGGSSRPPTSGQQPAAPPDHPDSAAARRRGGASRHTASFGRPRPRPRPVNSAPGSLGAPGGAAGASRSQPEPASVEGRASQAAQ